MYGLEAQHPSKEEDTIPGHPKITVHCFHPKGTRGSRRLSQKGRLSSGIRKIKILFTLFTLRSLYVGAWAFEGQCCPEWLWGLWFFRSGHFGRWSLLCSNAYTGTKAFKWSRKGVPIGCPPYWIPGTRPTWPIFCQHPKESKKCGTLKKVLQQCLFITFPIPQKSLSPLQHAAKWYLGSLVGKQWSFWRGLTHSLMSQISAIRKGHDPAH